MIVAQRQPGKLFEISIVKLARIHHSTRCGGLWAPPELRTKRLEIPHAAGICTKTARAARFIGILAEGAIALPVTLSGGALFAS